MTISYNHNNPTKTSYPPWICPFKGPSSASAKRKEGARECERERHQILCHCKQMPWRGCCLQSAGTGGGSVVFSQGGWLKAGGADWADCSVVLFWEASVWRWSACQANMRSDSHAIAPCHRGALSGRTEKRDTPRCKYNPGTISASWGQTHGPHGHFHTLNL